jgi:hypothetical protein
MKKLTLLLLLAFNLIVNAQDEKTVTLVTNGTGATMEQATQNALRSAIEQAFGTFISSKTEILNDELVKDEIVSVANGNIQSYEVISETEIPDIGYAVSLKATVSVTKLTSFVESKGFKVEVQGGLFATNIKIKQLNEQNEYKAIQDMLEVLENIIDKSFDYSLRISDPSQVDKDWKLDAVVDISFNKNIINFKNYLYNTMKSISLTPDEVKNYKEINRPTFLFSLYLDEDNFYNVVLRSLESHELFVKSFYNMIYNNIRNFKVVDGIQNRKYLFNVNSSDKYNPSEYRDREQKIEDKKLINKLRMEFNNEILFSNLSIYELSKTYNDVKRNLYFSNESHIKDLRPTEYGLCGQCPWYKYRNLKQYKYDPKYSPKSFSFYDFVDKGKLFSYNFSLVYTLEELNKIKEIRVEKIR